MSRRGFLIASVFVSGAVGLTVSSGSLAGFAVSILLPAVWVRQESPHSCFWTAFSYYLTALWSLPTVVRNFFGPNARFIDGIALWLIASVLLTIPWWFAWSAGRKSALWRVPIALLASIVPPLGLIGLASPTVSAGLLFPATGYTGFALTLFVPGFLAASPKRTAIVTAVLVLGCNIVQPEPPEPPIGWQGIDTQYGVVTNDIVEPVREYQIAEDLEARALASTARVIVFPESVLSRWTQASELFWADTFTALRSAGKVVVIGAITPQATPFSETDFASSLAAMHQSSGIHHPIRSQSAQHAPVAYGNGVVIRGASSGEFHQRMPVPLGMWRPFTNTGVSLRLFAPAVLQIADHTAALLICYEQLVPWPVLTAFIDRPSIMIAIANQLWVRGTPIPVAQRSSIRAWARLFHVAIISATNR